ncbi:MAG TPA: F0F1 ATP synthase subunit delta [Candidatus Saccharimonadia bacterium]|nr:F0F1 ATP synthase subunit delta [Candidatus Saccharimonadia bacterium]
MASRGQVAAFVASKLRDGRKDALKQAAAWLQDTGRARQTKYLAEDVAGVMAREGYVYARITTARKLSEAAESEVKSYIKEQTGAHNLELEMVVDRDVIGGVRVEVPGAEIDATVRRKLARFVHGGY